MTRPARALPMRPQPLARRLFKPFGGFASAWAHRKLVLRLARREIETKYRGSLLGVLWSIITPLFMLMVYTFVFGIVFQARWSTPEAEVGTREFALLLFFGLTLFWVFAECIGRAPSLVVENASYVKKVIFPLDILPWIVLIAALFQALVSFLIILLVYPFIFGAPPVTMIALPIVLLPFCLVVLGVTWGLAALGVFLRDVRQVVPVVITAMLFLSPIFFPLAAIPEQFHPLIMLNPITIVLQNARAVFFWGDWPDWWQIAGYYLGAIIVCCVGWMGFARVRRAFADVV
jgi:lipopolysaccharide transport system permease protein